MKVKDLIKILKQINGDRKIQMNADGRVVDIQSVEDYEKNPMGWEAVLEVKHD